MLKILVIDDNHISQAIFKAAIDRSQLPVEVFAAADGQEGLSLLRDLAFRPALILLEMNMLGMHGLEFLEAYANSYARKAHVVMISGSGCSADRLRALAYPFVTKYLAKPLSVGDILGLAELTDRLDRIAVPRKFAYRSQAGITNLNRDWV